MCGRSFATATSTIVSAFARAHRLDRNTAKALIP
jgi:hypothetical protein